MNLTSHIRLDGMHLALAIALVLACSVNLAALCVLS